MVDFHGERRDFPEQGEEADGQNGIVGQGHNGTETELPVAETESDVDENQNQGDQDRNDGLAQQFVGNGGLDLLVALDTRFANIGFLEGLLGRSHFVEALQSLVQFVVAVGFGLLRVIIDLIVDSDSQLVVVTESLHLRSSAEFCGDSISGGSSVNVLVEEDDVVTTTGEVDTGLQFQSEEGDDGDADKRTRNDVEGFLGFQEIEMDFGKCVHGDAVTEFQFLAFVQSRIEHHAGDEDSREERGEDTDNQGGGETLNRTGTEDVEHDTGNQGGDVTIDDG